MFSYTADQLALLRTKNVLAKVAVEIDAGTPRRYCSGTAGITYSGDYYEPRQIEFKTMDIADPARAKTKLKFADQDRALRNANYLNRFSDDPVSVHLFLRAEDTHDWTHISSLTWKCEYCDYDKEGNFNFNLHGASGLRMKAGAILGSRASFEYAPGPNSKLVVGTGKIVFYDAQ